MSRYRSRVRDFEFMEWVRQQPCALAHTEACIGRTEAHHAGPRGMGQKAPDDTCIPLCERHHRERHHASGYFKNITKEQRRVWEQATITATRQAYELYRGPNLL